MSTPRIFTGARAILNINNRLTIFATDVTYMVETVYRPIPEIDNSLPNELAPAQINVTVTVTNFRAAFNSASVDLSQPTIQNNMTQPYASIQLYDRGTNQTILFVPQAMMTRRSGRVSARTPGTESWTFIGIGYYDERLPGEATKLL